MKANIPQDLVDELKERFPNRCPNEDETDRQIWKHAGKCELIEYLELFAKRQQETILAPKQ